MHSLCECARKKSYVPEASLPATGVRSEKRVLVANHPSQLSDHTSQPVAVTLQDGAGLPGAAPSLCETMCEVEGTRGYILSSACRVSSAPVY